MPYTMIAVPNHLLEAVIELIESAEEVKRPISDVAPAEPPVPARSAEAERELVPGWTAAHIKERLETLQKERKGNEYLALVRFLADHSGELFNMEPLAAGLGMSYDALNGILSGFSKINKRDYGTTLFPWEVNTDGGLVRHGMSAEVAEVVQDTLRV